MNKLKTLTNSIAASIGLLLITGNSAYPQQIASLALTNQLQDLLAPLAITTQPQDQLVAVGSDVTLSVGAPAALACQWLCNGIAMDGQTNAVLTLTNVQISDAGNYSCILATSTQLAITSAASVQVMTFAPDGFLGLVVYAAPIVASGTLGTCPGHYVGYVNYTKPPSNGWGWTPCTNYSAFSATDNNRTNTKVEYLGGYGDSGCAKTSVNVATPLYSPAYRFTIYFAGSVPTTNYPITLNGFNP